MDTKFSIELIPHGSPIITYGLDQAVGKTLELTVPVKLEFDVDVAQGTHKFFLEFRNKTNHTPEMAIEIQQVSFEDIATDRMKWAGLYYPDYPEPWASQQTAPLESVIKSSTFLGWNGRWELEFSVPIFTWIHKLENLGWIYE